MGCGGDEVVDGFVGLGSYTLRDVCWGCRGGYRLVFLCCDYDYN